MHTDKAAQIDAIAEQVAGLEASPLYAYRQGNGYQPVIGEGSLDADIMFVGEAPGETEAETGRPFVGRAGQELDNLLASIGLAREDVYITNVVLDRPPGNRDPHVGEIELYAPFLRAQIEVIQPRVIATLGRFAMEFMLDYFDITEAQGQRISDLHGTPWAAEVDYGQVTVVPLYHPAAMFYNRSLEPEMQTDFQEVLGELVTAV